MKVADLRARRAAAQLLHRPFGADAGAIVRGLLAVQAQDARAARLALRARADRLTAAAVDAALTDERSLVVGWLMRGTLHLVAAGDYPWLHGLTAGGRQAGGGRRLAQLGVTPDDAERAVAAIERALADAGPQTRAELTERIAATGVRTEGQAAIHLLALAAHRGLAVLGPVRDGERCFAAPRDWLGAPLGEPPVGEVRDAALAELARRYVRAHGPATAADLAAWTGLALRDARAGLDAIARELDDLGGGLVDLRGRDEPPPEAREPRLLPAFDPYLLGWRDRSFAVRAAHARRVHPGGGIIRAVALVRGVAAGTWGARRRGSRVAVEVDAFGRLAATARRALDAEAADVARFEGS